MEIKASKSARALEAALFLTNCIFFATVLFFALHSRFAVDDFCIVAKNREYGFWGAQQYWYTTWIGRWSAIMTASLFGKFVVDSGRATWVNVFDFIGNWLALAFLFRNIFHKLEIPKRSYLTSLNFAGFGLQIIYWSTPNATQSWYWMAGSVCYSWPFISLFLVIALLIDDEWTSWRALLSFVLSAVVSGSNEILAGFSILILSVVFVYSAAKRRRELLARLSWPLLGALISFLCVALSPGNIIREATFPSHKTDFLAAMIHSFPEAIRILGEFVRHKIYWAILGAGGACYLFSFSRKTFRMRSYKSVVFSLIVSMGLIIVGNMILVFPGFLLADALLPDRSFITNSIWTLTVVVLEMAYLVLPLGERLRGTLYFRAGLVILVVSLFALAFYQAEFSIRRFNEVTRYSNAYDRDFRHILDARSSGRTEILFLSKLPFTNEYVTAPSLADSCLRVALDLKFPLQLSPE